MNYGDLLVGIPAALLWISACGYICCLFIAASIKAFRKGN